jgi:type III secretion protein F
MSDGLSFVEIAETLGKASGAAEDDMRVKMRELASKGDVSSKDLMMFQAELQKWNLMHQMQSTMVKDLGDTLKGIIQKAA